MSLIPNGKIVEGEIVGVDINCIGLEVKWGQAGYAIIKS